MAYIALQMDIIRYDMWIVAAGFGIMFGIMFVSEYFLQHASVWCAGSSVCWLSLSEVRTVSNCSDVRH